MTQNRRHDNETDGRRISFSNPVGDNFRIATILAFMRIIIALIRAILFIIDVHL